MRRPTPCVGICSTTYGDLVCRGCKRFAHEIVQWNSYDDTQREEIWLRLRNLSLGAVQRYLSVADPLLLAKYLALLPIDSSMLAPDQPPLLRAYECLRRQPDLDPSTLGLELHLGLASVASLTNAVEAEFFARAEAQYEHNYKVPVR